MQATGGRQDSISPRDRAVLQAAATALLKDIDAVTNVVAGTILDRQPDLVSPAADDAVASVYRASEANVTAILATLAGGVRPDTLDVPEGALDLLDYVAVEAEALPVMLRAYRLGAADLSAQWLGHLAHHVDDIDSYARLATFSFAHIGTYVDRISEVLVSRWTTLIEEAARSGRRQRATLLALLEGTPADPAHLDHPLDVSQLVIGSRVAEGDHGHSLALAHALDIHGRAARMSIELPEGTTLNCLALADPISPDVIAATVAALPEGGWKVVAAAPAGVDAMVQTGRDVRNALRILPLARPSGARTSYGDIALLCTLLADEQNARRTARAILGPLAEQTTRSRRLRDTLRAYFAAGERKTGAAATLGIHEKTVGLRLRQVEDILGHNFYTRRTELDAALLIERSIGLAPRDNTS